jgi:hypothetical protein
MIIVAKEDTVNFRVFEKEMMEKYFGEVKTVNPYLFKGVYSLITHEPTTVLWHPNTEYTSYDKIGLMIEQEKLIKQTFPHVRFINSAFGWVNNYCKIMCFIELKKYGFQIPEFLPFKEKSELKNFPFPYLIRVNNECSGYASYLCNNEEQLNTFFPLLQKEQFRIHHERGNNPQFLAVQFLDSSLNGYRRSYRIIVAGSKVVTGYARYCKPPQWVAIAKEFKKESKEDFVQFNKTCEAYIRYDERNIVGAVQALKQSMVGIDIMPVQQDNGSDKHYILEIQPGFSCGYSDPSKGFLPPFYNPSYPELVNFLLQEKGRLQQEIPLYYNVWLDKEKVFDTVFSELKRFLYGRTL